MTQITQRLNPTRLAVLRKLYLELANSGLNWVVTGSLAFALQGLPVEPDDIDLQTDRAGAYEIERRLAKFVTRPVSFSAADKIRSHFGALEINGLKVEIMGDIQKRLPDGTWEAPVDLERHKCYVNIEHMQIPVLSLDYEYTAYLKLGRIQKAEMLKDWLNRSKR